MRMSLSSYSLLLALVSFALFLPTITSELEGKGAIWMPVTQEVKYNESIHSHQKYIVAESTSGLSNRLRVLAAYMYVGEFKFNAKLAFIWDYTSACPG
jgi:hypothetical protein